MKLFTKQMLGILSAVTVGLVAVLIVGQSGFIAPTSSNLSTYTITMNNETTNDWDFLSKSEYNTTEEVFRYTKFKFEDEIRGTENGYSLQLQANTGKVYNTSPINGLISLSVSYVSGTNLIASFGNESNPSTSSFNIVSGQTYSLSKYAQNTYLSIKTGSKYARISEIKITYSCIPVEQTTLTSLNITSLPYKTTYVVGNTLDTTGLVITANYSNGSSKVVTSECVLNPKNGDILSTAGTQIVTCTYTENDVTVNTSFTVEVNASTSEEISEIILTASPNEIEVGETTTINLEVVPSTASRSVTWSSSDNNIASVSSTGVVTGISEGRAIITATSTQNANIKGTIEIIVLDSSGVEPSVKTYTKVTETPSDWSGQYLIVYDNWAFDGSLTKLDAINNYQTITIENDTIEEEGDIYFNIEKLDNSNYSIQSASGYYIGWNGNKNGLTTSTSTPYENTLALNSDSTINIQSENNATLRFNDGSDQNRFRYYASGQKSIELYRNGTSSSGSEDEKTLSLSASKTTIKVGETITLQVTSNFSTSVTFTSSDNNIATVNDAGLVTGINVGSATITAASTIDETIKASIIINVIDASEVHPEIIIVSNYKDTYNVGDTLDFTGIKVTGYFEDYSEIDVTDKCTFSPAEGTLLTEAGTITITCTYTPTGITDSFEITVVGETQTLTKQDVKYDYHDLKQNGIYNTPAMPSTGNSKMLVVPIWFADSSNYINSVEKSSIRSDIEEAYFGEANTSSLPWHSVKSYYETESKGTLNLSGKVTDWYETSYSSTTITSDQVDSLVEDVGNSLKQQLGSEYNSYDTDKDGYIDALILIYAAPNCNNDNKVSESLWAYCFWLQQENYNINNPIANTYFWASYDFMYESGNDHIDAHTYIHEMGHVLGLDDYYDYAYEYGNNPAAGFSMQDYNVGSHDPFSQMALGWVEPYVPTDDITIEIESFQESGDVILLSPEWTGSPFDEYLLLELYTPTGLNAYDVNNSGIYISGPNDIGIRLWHVDARLRRYYESGNYIYVDTSNHYTDFVEGNYYGIGATNTTYVANQGLEGYYAEVSEDRNYDLLALIRNSRANDDEMQDNLNSLMLFKAGDSFTMSSYMSQFPKGSVLNSGSSLGFSFEVLSIDEVNLTATIQIQKL